MIPFLSKHIIGFIVAVSIAALGGPAIQKATAPYMPCVYFKLNCSLGPK